MKKMVIFAALMLSIFAASAQSKVYNLDAKKPPKTEVQLKVNSTITKDKATYKGKSYPVYLSATGKTFIIVRSLTSGNLYRKYFKL